MILDTDLIIFFDESGKQKSDKVQLMGGWGLPSNIYNSDKLSDFRKLNMSYRYHWSEYKGDSKQKNGIIKLFNEGNPLSEYIQLNFIQYSSSNLAKRANKYHEINGESSKRMIEKMVYSKLPERIVYGLLREYGHTQPVTVLVNIESANEYKTLGLAKNMKEQLNIHSLYRGKSFVVKACQYRKKGEEIGGELTDILLGIVRTIIENNHSESRRKREQINLILLLLRRNLLQPFYEN